MRGFLRLAPYLCCISCNCFIFKSLHHITHSLIIIYCTGFGYTSRIGTRRPRRRAERIWKHHSS